LAYADDVNTVGENIDTIQRNTKESRENQVYVGVKVSEGRTEAEHKDRE
jgi:hypothetical protein